MARFISRYTNHRLKAPGGIIRFEGNECVLEDQEQIDYLRKHPDYGVVIFEDKTRDEPKDLICPYCEREFRSRQGYASHIKSCRAQKEAKEAEEDEA